MDTTIQTIRKETTEACFEFVMQNMKSDAFVKKAFQYSETRRVHKKISNKLILNKALVLLQILEGLEKLAETNQKIRKKVTAENIENLQKIVNKQGG